MIDITNNGLRVKTFKDPCKLDAQVVEELLMMVLHKIAMNYLSKWWKTGCRFILKQFRHKRKKKGKRGRKLKFSIKNRKEILCKVAKKNERWVGGAWVKQMTRLNLVFNIWPFEDLEIFFFLFIKSRKQIIDANKEKNAKLKSYNPNKNTEKYIVSEKLSVFADVRFFIVSSLLKFKEVERCDRNTSYNTGYVTPDQ